jgi:hypothetical protein
MAAPNVVAPLIVRDGPADPVTTTVDAEHRAATAIQAAMEHASHGRSVAIICPAVHREAIEAELTARDVAWRAASRSELGQGINLVSPQEAKGLEFDAVVVVEPDDIIAEDERGHRLLYVALTRTTRYLHIVGVQPVIGGGEPPLSAGTLIAKQATESSQVVSPTIALAEALEDPPLAAAAPIALSPPPPPARAGGLAAQIVELVALELASQVRENLQPSQWQAVLDRVTELLGETR